MSNYVLTDGTNFIDRDGGSGGYPYEVSQLTWAAMWSSTTAAEAYLKIMMKSSAAKEKLAGFKIAEIGIINIIDPDLPTSSEIEVMEREVADELIANPTITAFFVDSDGIVDHLGLSSCCDNEIVMANQPATHPGVAIYVDEKQGLGKGEVTVWGFWSQHDGEDTFEAEGNGITVPVIFELG